MKKVNVHLHEKEFTKKPIKEVGIITNEITREITTISIKKLALEVAKGRTLLPAIMNGKSSNNNLIEQQMVLLDFDNTEFLLDEYGKKVKDEKGKYITIKTTGENYLTVEKMLENEFIKNNAAFIYYSFSNKEEWTKFRVAFVLNKKLENYDEVKAVYEYLLNLFPGADHSCKNSSRLFFGGTNVLEVNYNNELNVNSIVKNVKTTVKSVKNIIKKAPVLYQNIIDGSKTWELIKEGKKEELKGKLNKYSIKLHSKVQVVNYLKTIDMREFLEIYENPFNDIFHVEDNPSASIFKMDNSDTYLYKCFSESNSFTGDIVLVVQKLTGMNYFKTVNFLMEVCSIQIEETEKIREIKDKVDLYINQLLSEELKEVFPEIHSIFWRYKNDMVSILNIMKENIYEDESGEIRSLTWMSTRTLSLKLYGTENKFDKISKILNLMVYTNWIEKLEEKDIPKNLLERLLENKNGKGFNKRSNVFELVDLGEEFFEELSIKCDELKLVGFTMKGFSKDFVINADNNIEAKKVFVQDIIKTTKSTNKTLNIAITVINEMINKNGYAVESDVVVEIKKQLKSKNFSEYKLKQIRPALINDYCLSRVRMTKDLKEKFNIDGNDKSMPSIYIK